MKELFAKFMDMPVSVRVSVVFLSVVLAVVAFITAVNAPLLLVSVIVGLGSAAALVRLIFYFETGE